MNILPSSATVEYLAVASDVVFTTINQPLTPSVYRKAPQNDQLIRITREPGNNECQIQYLGRTNTFAFKIRNLIQENVVLVNIMRNLWNTHRYNQEYISYLLGNYSKEEFITIANAFAEPLKKDFTNEYLAVASDVVFTTINQPLTSLDLSIFLNVDSAVIDRKMPALGYIPDDSESE